MDTNISELAAPKTDKKPVVQPCFTCHSTSHKVRDCPIHASMVKKEMQKQFKAMRGKGGKNRGRGGKQGGKNNGRKFFPKAENIKKEPKNQVSRGNPANQFPNFLPLVPQQLLVIVQPNQQLTQLRTQLQLTRFNQEENRLYLLSAIFKQVINILKHSPWLIRETTLAHVFRKNFPALQVSPLKCSSLVLQTW